MGNNLAVYCVLMGLFSACGPNDFAKRKRVGSNSDENVGIWSRSPTVDSGLRSLTALDDLENRVPKTFVPLNNLEEGAVHGEGSVLKNENFLVHFSLQDKDRPSFSKWQGKEVPWDEKDFQAFMAYSAVERSFEYIKRVFPDLDLKAAQNLSGEALLPLKVEAVVCCDAFNTGYDPVQRVVSFFEHGTAAGEDKLKNFRMADELDVVFHELGHVLQHAVNPDLLETNYDENPDIDALLEGLSDYFAAAVLRDRSILSYMEGNISRILAQSGSRTGEKHLRNLNNSLAYPAGYRQESHLDGRVVSSMLADAADIFKAQGNLNVGAAMDASLKLAMHAYQMMATSSTLHQFSRLMLSEYREKIGQETCADNVTCMTATLEKLQALLLSRGLLGTSTTSSTPRLAVDYRLETGLGFEGIQISATQNYKSNRDAVLDPCEIVMVYPKIYNDNRNVPLMEGLMLLEKVTGFTSASQDGEVLESLSSSSNQGSFLGEPKLIPWLNGGDSTLALIGNRSSRLYQVQHGGSYAQPLSKNYFPSELGWLVRAPRSGSASIQVSMQMRPYNSSTQMRYVTLKSKTLSLIVSGTQNFCD